MEENLGPPVLPRDILIERPDGNPKSLVRAEKAVVADDANCVLDEKLHSLWKQGELSRCMDVRCGRVSFVMVQSLPEEQMKFSLNAAPYVFPHNANLHMWKRRQDPSCPLCSYLQSLLHILNNCPIAKHLRRNNTQHNKVLHEIATPVKPRHLPPLAVMAVDIEEDYAFPFHIVPTDLRPGLVGG